LFICFIAKNARKGDNPPANTLHKRIIFMEIAPNIHRIPCIFGGNRIVFVHLLIGTDASMLVDTACAHNPQQDILPYMAKIGFDPKHLTYIVISHSDLDHQGGNQPMKDAAPQAILACHNLDKPWIEDTESLLTGRYMQFDEPHGFVTDAATRAAIHADTLSAPIDLTLEGGETFRLSPEWYVQAIHTPGHTWGHLAVYDPKSKTLISGEAALWNAILDVDWNPALPPTYCYVDTYLATLDRLMNMDIELLAPAHWQLQRGSAVGDFLRESRNYCLRVEQKLLDFAKSAGSFTMKQAMEHVGPAVSSWDKAGGGLLVYPFNGNLQRLVQRGQLIEQRNTDNIITWSLRQ
jgi:glyoxylase-like metal-dependent hydrolase (beta-lactamase superfamily II)